MTSKNFTPPFRPGPITLDEMQRLNDAKMRAQSGEAISHAEMMRRAGDHPAPAAPGYFQFEGRAVRHAADAAGNPWFAAMDVVQAVDAVWNGSQNIQHVPAEWRGVISVMTPSGRQELIALSEHGVYFYLTRSDKPKALPLQKWIAGEVLPSIRRTGGYGNQEPAKPKTTLELLESAVAEIKARDAEIAQKNAALGAAERDNHRLETISGYQGVIIQKYEDALVGYSRISDTSASWSVTTVAALLGQPRNRFCNWLRAEKFTYPFETGRPGKPGWQPHANIRAEGLMVLRFHNGKPGYDDFDAGYGHPSARFTMKGILHLAARSDLPNPHNRDLRRARENIRLTGNPFDDGSDE